MRASREMEVDEEVRPCPKGASSANRIERVLEFVLFELPLAVRVLLVSVLDWELRREGRFEA